MIAILMAVHHPKNVASDSIEFMIQCPSLPVVLAAYSPPVSVLVRVAVGQFLASASELVEGIHRLSMLDPLEEIDVKVAGP